MQQRDSFIGKELGAYLIQSKLGEGGMARVYKAYHARLHREAAIKIITPTVRDPHELAEFHARFEREAQLIASLEHRNIVAVYDFDDRGDITYLVMQYIGGGTLRNHLRSGQPMEPRRSAHYTLQMARALHHAHQRGIVHRDVKPQNMLVSASDPDYLLLSDFGIAKLFNESIDTVALNNIGAQPVASSTLTSTGMFIGTAAYMAPEQVLRKPLDARTDVYALGVVLYQMLTGNTPFQANSQYGLMIQNLNTPPRPVRTVNPNVPESLAYVAEKALEKDPARRFQSAEEMARTLEAVLASLSTVVQGQSAPFAASAANPQTPLPGSAPYAYVDIEQQTQISRPEPITPPGAVREIQANVAPLAMPAPDSAVAGLRSNRSELGEHGALRPPAKKRRRNKLFSIYNLAYAAVAILAIYLLVSRLLPGFNLLSLFSGSPPQSNSTAASNLTGKNALSFTDTFQDNRHQWSIGGEQNGFSATVGGGKYSITNVSDFHIPHPPESAVGNLPPSFVYSASITMKSSGTEVYGIVFNLKLNGDVVVSGYAFTIDNNKKASLWKYQGVSPMPLFDTTGTTIKPGKENVVQVSAEGNTFSFSINGQALAINGSQSYTDKNAPQLSSGQPGLLVSGANAQYVVTRVELTIP